jgi:acetylornithine deacetylase
MSEARVVDTLARLVAYPTVSDRPVTEIAAYLAQLSQDAGFEVTQLPTGPGKSNVIARAGPRGEGGLVLSGHMDVVPTEGQDWSTDPFRLTERDGALVGRGTADMKGFIAAVHAALVGFPITRLRREIVLIWTHDEEVGCLGARELVDRWANTLDPLPPDAWIGEPTDLHVCHMHPGHTTMDIHCTGRPAHSSRPELGLSAIHLAGEVLEILRGVASRWRAHPSDTPGLPSPHTVMNVGHICGGSAINIVPEHCSLSVGIRPLPGQDGIALIAEIEAALHPLTTDAAQQGGKITLSIRQASPPMLTDPDTPLAAALLPHASGPDLQGVPFATDGGHLNRLGTRCLIFGPGSIDVAHRPDESVPAQALEQTVGIVRQVLVGAGIETSRA